MTSKNKIWKIASSYSEAKAILLLEKLFPSLSKEIIDYEVFPPIISQVSTKEEALRRLRLGLKKITETEASYYLEKLEEKTKARSIKF